MDHKVSKDMISSGMIPSGEKTQADLGRIQYGSTPSPSSLMDAYKSIYEHHQKDKDGNTIPHEGEQLNEGKMPEGLKNYLMKKGKKDDKKEDKKEKVDENLMQGIKTVGKDIGNAASTVYKDVKGAIKNRYQKFKDHQKARGMGLDLKGGKISSDGTYSKTSPGGGFMSYDLRFDTDLFDLVKGDLINEGLTDGEASRMMLEMREEITFLYSIDEGIAGMALKLGGAALGAYGVKKAAEKMGTMSGTPKTPPAPKKPGLIQKLKDRKDATNKAIEQM